MCLPRWSPSCPALADTARDGALVPVHVGHQPLSVCLNHLLFYLPSSSFCFHLALLQAFVVLEMGFFPVGQDSFIVKLALSWCWSLSFVLLRVAFLSFGACV